MIDTSECTQIQIPTNAAIVQEPFARLVKRQFTRGSTPALSRTLAPNAARALEPQPREWSISDLTPRLKVNIIEDCEY